MIYFEENALNSLQTEHSSKHQQRESMKRAKFSSFKIKTY